jgi:predicted nucleic acid-binding protein
LACGCKHITKNFFCLPLPLQKWRRALVSCAAPVVWRGQIALTIGGTACWLRMPMRILPLDAQSARLAGQISDAAIAQGRHPGFADVAIAALAQNAEPLLLSCNLKHFQSLCVACADPLIALPA